jgi:hypothetical protein
MRWLLELRELEYRAIELGNVIRLNAAQREMTDVAFPLLGLVGIDIAAIFHTDLR